MTQHATYGSPAGGRTVLAVSSDVVAQAPFADEIALGYVRVGRERALAAGGPGR